MNEHCGGMPLNDQTDYGLCFACGPRNKNGLNLHFQRDGDVVKTTLRTREEHQGFPGYMHGGIITTVLDEVMSRVSMLENRWTMTVRLDVRFKKPVSLSQVVVGVASKVDEKKGFIETEGRLLLPDSSDAAIASGTFFLLDEGSLAKLSEGYPKLSKQWMR